MPPVQDVVGSSTRDMQSWQITVGAAAKRGRWKWRSSYESSEDEERARQNWTADHRQEHKTRAGDTGKGSGIGLRSSSEASQREPAGQHCSAPGSVRGTSGLESLGKAKASRGKTEKESRTRKCHTSVVTGKAAAAAAAAAATAAAAAAAAPTNGDGNIPGRYCNQGEEDVGSRCERTICTSASPPGLQRR